MIVAHAIFLSYRRDTLKSALNIYQAVDPEKKNVFIDQTGLGGGIRFPDRLLAEAAGCRLMIVVIGASWLGLSRDSRGIARIMQDDDWVRREVAIALAGGKAILPVLLDDVPMPSIDQLPTDLHDLWKWQAMPLRETSYVADLDKIVDDIRKIPDLIGRERAGKKKATTDSQFGLWVEVKASNDPERIRTFILDYDLDASIEQMCRDVLEGLEWRRAMAIEDANAKIFALNAFIAEFQTSSRLGEARTLLASTREALAETVWKALDRNDAAAIDSFLADWSDTRAAQAAEDRREFLQREARAWSSVELALNRRSLEVFLRDFPDGPSAPKARALLAGIDWAEARRSRDPDRMDKHRRDHSESPHLAEAAKLAEEERRIELAYRAAAAAKDPKMLRAFREAHRGSRFDAECQRLLDMLEREAELWERLKHWEDRPGLEAIRDMGLRYGVEARARLQELDAAARERARMSAGPTAQFTGPSSPAASAKTTMSAGDVWGVVLGLAFMGLLGWGLFVGIEWFKSASKGKGWGIAILIALTLAPVLLAEQIDNSKKASRVAGAWCVYCLLNLAFFLTAPYPCSVDWRGIFLPVNAMCNAGQIVPKEPQATFNRDIFEGFQRQFAPESLPTDRRSVPQSGLEGLVDPNRNPFAPDPTRPKSLYDLPPLEQKSDPLSRPKSLFDPPPSPELSPPLTPRREPSFAPFI